MKKISLYILSVLFISFLFNGCGQSDNPSDNQDKITIVTTIFPYYDFARQICTENAEVTLLLPPGLESHSYEPSAKDIIDIQNCDLFIYTGGESDEWVKDILASFETEVETLKIIDYVEGVTEPGEVEYDEHIWTSPLYAMTITETITDKVKEIDPDKSDLYNAMSNNFLVKLDILDQDFKEFFDTVNNKTLIFGDRFPFRYFAEEYGLDYFAAFPGCSSDTEPSAGTIASLIDKVNSESISTIFYVEFSNHKIADAIAEATGKKTAMLHSCHNVTREDLENGATYISLMEQNLETLKEAMN